jgi:Tol biopolymer transport system component
MSIGNTFPGEMKQYKDASSGRSITQYTTADAHSYPLYYFIPSHTADSRYVCFHSERSGYVQLYRLDTESGEIAQLTDSHTRESGWAIWCEPHLRGIYNHLSALNVVTNDAFFFQDEEVRSTNLITLENRHICDIPGRISIGQTGFSPDGKSFAFIHADRNHFVNAYSDREALQNMKRFEWEGGHQAWRNNVPCTISLIDTETGTMRDVIELDYHVHHVFYLDENRLLVNHPKDTHGMWIVNLDGSDVRILRPADDHGSIVHQVVTDDGIYYEAVKRDPDARENWFGRYDVASDTFDEVQMPGLGYVHTGFDPGGKFLFFENDNGETHQLLSAHHPHDPDRYELRVLKTLTPIQRGQRFHAHPFLSPNRKQLFYTEVLEGYSQVCAMDVEDLVDLEEYW